MSALEDFLRQYRPEAPAADPALLDHLLSDLPARRSPRRWPWLVAVFALLLAAGAWQQSEQYALNQYLLAVWETELAALEWDFDER